MKACSALNNVLLVRDWRPLEGDVDPDDAEGEDEDDLDGNYILPSKKWRLYWRRKTHHL